MDCLGSWRPIIKDLTQRQKDVFESLRDFIEVRGYPPTLRELSLRFKIKGANNVAKHLVALEKKGYIKRRPYTARAIEICAERLVSGIGLISVPMAGIVRAGRPHAAIEDMGDTLQLDPVLFRRAKGCFGLKAKGESMSGAGIDDGDTLIIRPDKDAKDGDIVVALIGGDATVKSFYREGDMVVLRPQNPSYEPITIDGSSGDEFSIAGRVVYVIKDVSVNK